MERLNSFKSDNKGLTLVELLVTLAVSAVLATAVSVLIGYSINTYQNESVNTALQSELQTNVNQMMDAIMSSSGAVIKQGATATEYAAFGQFKDKYKDEDGSFECVVFDGTVFLSGPSGEVYLGRGSGSGATSEDAAKEVIDMISTAVTTDGRPYLLGQNAKEFWIMIDPGCYDSTTHTYTNPLMVNVRLEFERNGAGKVINKKVTDNATMRNKATADIYIDEIGYKLAKQ